MKKYLLKLTALVLFVGTLVSCSEDKVFYDGSNGPTLAQFLTTNGTFGVSPTKNLKSIPVQVSTISNVDRHITVSIDTLGSTENVGDFIEIVSAESLIPAGEYEGKIVVKYTKTYDDLTFDNNLLAVLKLDAVEGASVEKNKSRFDLEIYKSCDFKQENVGTEFTATVEVNASPQVPATFGESYSPVVTQNPSKLNEFSFDTLWGMNFVDNFVNGGGKYAGQYVAPGKILVNDDLSLTITPAPSDNYISGGTGTYDACKNVFVYTLTQVLFGPGAPNTVTVTLTPPAPPVQP